MVDDCWIRSRLGKRDQLKGGNVASWKQAKQTKQVWKLGVCDAGAAYSLSPHLDGTLRKFHGSSKRLQGKSEADNVTIRKLGAYRRPNRRKLSLAIYVCNLPHASL